MSSPGHGIRLRSSARSDRGRVRQNNEDNVHLWAEDQYVLAVVADGMGGAVAGEEASRIAIETIRNTMTDDTYRQPDDYRNVLDKELAKRLEHAVAQANLNIISRQYDMPELKGMGTTVTMAFARGREVTLAHVGDSRAYVVDGADGSIQQVTDDHSFVQALIDAGHITPEEAEDHPMKNVLYRALGQAEDVEIDVVTDVRVHIGDRIVLCSDGLTLHVSPQEIADTAMHSDDPNTISDTLINLANARGGKDNISVIVITVESDGATQATIDDRDATEPVNTEDDVITFPMNPDFHSITRSVDTKTKEPSTPNGSDSSISSNYGEGHDSFEPFQ